MEHEIVITEKLDGENTCLKQSGVYARSHVAPTRNPWAGNMWDIWKTRRNILGELEVFGENLYGIHSIEYRNLPHYFFIFAIRDGKTWLSWEEVAFYAEAMDLPLVPVYEKSLYDEHTIQASIMNGMKQGSAFGDTIEGFVCRNSAAFDESQFTQNVLKYVRKNHIQTDIHWTKNWRRAKLWFEYPQS